MKNLEKFENEIWKPVKGYDGLYEVSDLGRVKSLKRIVKRKRNGDQIVNEKILTQKLSSGGYMRVCLTSKNKCKYYSVHRLVAEAFIPNVENKPEVNHKNFKRNDNRVTNLEWVTHKENSIYSSENIRKANLGRPKNKTKSNSGEPHIYLNKYGTYTVSFCYKYKKWYKTFKDFKQAIEYRDSTLNALRAL